MSESSLQSAVKAEVTNWNGVSPLYGKAASELSELFGKPGADSSIHLYMCAAQDLTTDPTVWNRVMTGTKRALKSLPIPLQFSETRDFRGTHRAKNPLFVIVKVSDAETAKADAAKTSKEKADAIEKAAMDERAANLIAADAAITPEIIAADVRAECERLNIRLSDVLQLLGVVGARANESDAAYARIMLARAHTDAIRVEDIDQADYALLTMGQKIVVDKVFIAAKPTRTAKAA